jgi:hypothetical protein
MIMSRVTNVILTFSINENEDLIRKELDEFKPDGNKAFASIDGPNLPRGWYGGTKIFEAPLYIGALNHVSTNQILDFLKSCHWQEPEYVQLIVREEEDEEFRIMKLR